MTSNVYHSRAGLLAAIKIILCGTLLLMLGVSNPTLAEDATWLASPESGDWNTTTNWTLSTIPDTSAYTGTFGVSNTTELSFSVNTLVGGIKFDSGSSAYTITTNPATSLTLSGTGITNNSSNMQNFVTAANGAAQWGSISFTNSATAGINTAFSNSGAMVSGTSGGTLQFFNNATAFRGKFTNNGGTVSGAGGGSSIFNDSSNAAIGNFTNNGGTVSGASGGTLVFNDSSSAGNSILTANGGTSGGLGGVIAFYDDSTGGNSSVNVSGNGSLDISAHSALGVTIGSLEGSGNVYLGGQKLTVGSNNQSKTLSGVIQDGGIVSGSGGSFEKIGSGTMTLSGINNYTGATVVSGGVLRLDGASSLRGGTDTTAATGESALILNGGVLGLGAGSFTRNLGTGDGQVQFTGGGGFAAYAANRSVDLGGVGTAVTWSSGGFVTNGNSLILGASDATHTVTLQNGINLAGAARTIQVNDGLASVDAIISGPISNGSLIKTGEGTLRLTGGNTYNGGTTIKAGILAINNSSAGSKTFTNDARTDNYYGVYGGITQFNGTSTADHSIIINNGTVSDGLTGGSTQFIGTQATAGHATFYNNAGAVGANLSAFTGGFVDFFGATADHATFYNYGSASQAGGGGMLRFQGTSKAANAIIYNYGGGVGGLTFFAHQANAEQATIYNYGGSSNLESGGFTRFYDQSSAGSSTIINDRATGSGAYGGTTVFQGSSKAGSSTIIANGNTSQFLIGAPGASVEFRNSSSAENATLIANGGTNGGEGGRIFFFQASQGGTAKVQVYGNGFLDINSSAGLTIGSLEGTGNVYVGSGNLLVGSNAQSTSFSGSIRDNGNNGGTGGSFTKIGAGILTLGGTNTYTGGTVIQGGSVILATGGTLGSGSVTNNGNLSVSHSDSITISNNISGSGSFVQMGAGATTLTANNTFNGGTTISAGTLQLGNGGTTGSVAGNIENNSHLIFNRSDNLSFGGIISGSGDVTKLGAGILNFTNNNNYTGSTFVNGGTLTVQGSIMGPGGLVTVAADATLNGTGTLNRDVLVNSNGSLASSLIITGQVTLANQQSVGAVSSGGTTTALIGQQVVVTTASTGGTVNAAAGTASIVTLDGATLNTGNWGASVVNLTSGTVNTSGGSLVAQQGSFNGSISGSGGLTKAGAGTLKLNTANSYTGTTIVKDGTLEVAVSGATGSAAPVRLENDGVLRVNSSVAIAGNVVTTSADAKYVKEFGAGESLSNYGSFQSNLSGSETTVTIAQGTATVGKEVTMQFSNSGGFGPNGPIASDRLSITGLNGTSFLLVMDVNMDIPVNPDLNYFFLGWFDPNGGALKNAVEGNDGYGALAAGYKMSYQSFLLEYSEDHDGRWDPVTMLGAYGADADTNQVWAVINHNSEFAVAPEPSTCGLLLLGSATLIIRRRRR